MRVYIFIDFWNFSLGARDLWGSSYRIKYQDLPRLLMQQVRSEFPEQTYEGTRVYASVDPNSPNDRRLANFLRQTIDRLPGYGVKIFHRRPKYPPKCNHCQTTITTCPHCRQRLRGMMEKGVDTSIVTEMLQLAWDNTYDLGFLLSADRDFIPAVDFLQTRGKKIVHAGYDPHGLDLAARCWTHINLVPLKEDLGEDRSL